MGPRSYERGNGSLGKLEAIAPVLLQWGRVLMNAEIFKSVAENRVKAKASMGPRSYERGNLKKAGEFADEFYGFNGAAFL